jgi:hypothetical protein
MLMPWVAAPMCTITVDFVRNIIPRLFEMLSKWINTWFKQINWPDRGIRVKHIGEFDYSMEVEAFRSHFETPTRISYEALRNKIDIAMLKGSREAATNRSGSKAFDNAGVLMRFKVQMAKMLLDYSPGIEPLNK